MATEYKLSYTAEEINEKLGQIGNDKAIIDVTELPTEGVNESSFYRLISAQFVSSYYVYADNWICHCVNELPSVGEPVTTDMVNITGYYNVQDGEVYGYVDSMVSAAGGVPIGWYPIGILGQAFDIDWGGTITHIDDMVGDSAYVLLKYEFYVYKDGWMNVPFGYEQAPAFDIKWNGEIGDKFALDMSALGYVDTYMVKVSDEVFTVEQLIGATLTQTSGYVDIMDEYDFDTTTFAGAISVDGGGVVIVYSSDETNAALGLPSGYLTNGIYFAYMGNGGEPVCTDRFVAPTKVTKIDEKFLPAVDVDLDNLATVAKTGYYSDLIGKPTVYEDVIRYNTSQSLSSSQKSRARTNIDVYSKSEVDTKIATAIGTAIGSGY